MCTSGAARAVAFTAGSAKDIRGARLERTATWASTHSHSRACFAHPAARTLGGEIRPVVTEEERMPESTTESSAGRTSMMRRVNVTLRSLSADLGSAERVAFFCECPLPDCFAVLWMTIDEFDAAETWIVAAGHEACEPFPTRLVA
jgi:hypothetical protein